MSKAKKRRPKSSGRKSNDRPDLKRRRAIESRRAEAATVGWVIAMLATLLAEVFFATAWALDYAAGAERPDDALQMLPGLMLFIAAATGLVCLGLTLAVHHFRRTAPPRAFTAVAVIASVLPLPLLAWRALA